MATSLRTINRPRSLSDQVYLTLREYLGSGQLRSGQTLQEAAIAAQLGVSRTPVREVFARLASEGLLDSDGRSFMVPELAEADIEDIYELRLMLEPEALRKIASHITDRKQTQAFRDELAIMTSAHEAGDVQAFNDANYRFRTAWLRLVTNARLLRAIEQYADHVRYLRALTLGDKDNRQVVLKGLKRLAAALTAGDPEAAAVAMRSHLQEAKRILSEALLASNKESEGNGVQG
ncbi:MAG: GntR family transcriptional regulator [Xanthobacteraceae bacterium]|nr:MAG: GntR family transcriptional regulator [Xanthobacteraceae bacterium]